MLKCSRSGCKNIGKIKLFTFNVQPIRIMKRTGAWSNRLRHGRAGSNWGLKFRVEPFSDGAESGLCRANSRMTVDGPDVRHLLLQSGSCARCSFGQECYL